MILPPISIDAANVLELKVPFKPPEPGDRVFVVEYQKCMHFHGFVVDPSLAEVTCKACKEKLNPMYVLGRLANEERRWHESFARYQDEMRRLNERSRTKCEHCKKLTRISHA